MARDSLPHFPAPEKSYRSSQSQSSQAYMYQPPYQQSGGIPGGYPPPAGGYQLAPSNVYGSPPQSYQQSYAYSGSSSQPPPGVDPQIFSRFKAADVNNTGQLTERELKTALLNSDWTQFDGKTIKLMIKMFDVDRSGTIGFQEFVSLCGYLDQWRALFQQFDQDRSGAIDRVEFANALSAFGYRLSDKFINLLYTSYDKKGDNQIRFDMFVQSMVTVKTLTDAFKTLDTDRDGVITIGFEQFLEIVLRQR